MDSELKQYFDELNGRIDGLSAQMTSELGQMRGEAASFREETAAGFRKMREEQAEAHQETRRIVRAENALTQIYVDSTVNRFQGKFDLLADGIKNIDEKLDREAADIRAEMRQGFADTQALIRFSNGQRTRGAKR
jgi:hypothetical protein